MDDPILPSETWLEIINQLTSNDTMLFVTIARLNRAINNHCTKYLTKISTNQTPQSKVSFLPNGVPHGHCLHFAQNSQNTSTNVRSVTYYWGRIHGSHKIKYYDILGLYYQTCYSYYNFGIKSHLEIIKTPVENLITKHVYKFKYYINFKKNKTELCNYYYSKLDRFAISFNLKEATSVDEVYNIIPIPWKKYYANLI